MVRKSGLFPRPKFHTMTTRLRIHCRLLLLPALVIASLLSGCAGQSSAAAKHWYTPWRKAAIVSPEAVQELPVEALEGGSPPSLPQYWERNTLRVDLSAVAGSGSARLLPSTVNGWPLRMVFSVRPGSLKQLEVTGEKRVVFNVAEAAGEATVFALGSGAYDATTKALTLHWE
jgi:hypothetical protein